MVATPRSCFSNPSERGFTSENNEIVQIPSTTTLPKRIANRSFFVAAKWSRNARSSPMVAWKLQQLLFPGHHLDRVDRKFGSQLRCRFITANRRRGDLRLKRRMEYLARPAHRSNIPLRCFRYGCLDLNLLSSFQGPPHIETRGGGGLFPCEPTPNYEPPFRSPAHPPGKTGAPIAVRNNPKSNVVRTRRANPGKNSIFDPELGKLG
jgi:hypothetical protein